MSLSAPRPGASLLRRHLWKIILSLALVAWAVAELIPLQSVPFIDYARAHATREFSALADEAVARKNDRAAPSEFVALQQIARERKLDLSPHFPGIRLEESLQNVERRNTLVLGELVRRARGRVQRGLDLAGGVSLTLEVDERVDAVRDPVIRRERIAKAIAILGKRLNAHGVAEPVIRPVGTHRIEIQLPDVSIRDNPDLIALIKKPARLEFRSVHPTLRPAAGGETPVGYEPLTLEDDGRSREPTFEELFVARVPDLSGEMISEAAAETDMLGRAKVTMQLTADGARRFADLTSRLSDQGKRTGRLAIVLDGKLQSAPLVNQEIRDGAATISGGRMSERDALDLANVLNNPLDLPLVIREQYEIGPSLAQTAIHRGVRAAVIGTALVAAFMVTFYTTGGLVAVFTLAINLLIIAGVMATLGAAITLPGLAGIVLTIGMAVDANILIFERLREELAAGHALAVANQLSYRKALTTILDAHLVQLIICAVMIWLGHGPIKGFGVTLLIGVLSTLFSVLITAHLVMELLIDSGTVRRFTLRRLIKDLRLDFIRFGKPMFVASWLVVLLGIATIFHRGQHIYGIDFTGGDVVSLQFSGPVPADGEIRQAVTLSGVRNFSLTTVRVANSERATLKIESPEETAGAVVAALQQAFPQSGIEAGSTHHVGGAVGRETQLNALLAVGVSMLTILLYIAFRFEFGYGVGALVATVHDLLMTVGIFVLTDRQFNGPMVAALLCIAGYSINETVVVFDRIREELKLNPTGTLRAVVNDAIRKVFARTIMTASTTFLAALALYLFGGGVLRDISFTFLVGIGTSTFSAIFVAAQVFYWWHRGDRMRVEGAEAGPKSPRPWERPKLAATPPAA